MKIDKRIFSYNGRNEIRKINATGDKLTLKIGNSTVYRR